MQGPINLAELKRIHGRFLKRHEAVVKDAMTVGGRGAKEYVRNRSSFKRRSGSRSLKDNTKARIIKTRGGKILRLKWTKKYAGFVEDGTRRHPISVHEVGGGSGSTRGKALRFFWKKGPRGPGIYYYRSVMHPGTKPYRFGIRSAKHGHMIIGKRLREGMARAATKF